MKIKYVEQLCKFSCGNCVVMPKKVPLSADDPWYIRDDGDYLDIAITRSDDTYDSKPSNDNIIQQVC